MHLTPPVLIALVTASIALLVAVTVGIALLVAAASQYILVRQRQAAEHREQLQRKLAKDLEQMAGIQAIERLEDRVPYTSFAQVISEHEPLQQLDILATSGASLLSEDETPLKRLLNRGIDIKIMLLDPNSESNWLSKEYAGLTATEPNLDTLKRIAQTSGSGSGLLSVRLYPQPVLENLMFLDDERLFISSYLPSPLSRNRLIYEVRKGERSLYNLYEPAFDFLWRHSNELS
jgi:hypothetical protein